MKVYSELPINFRIEAYRYAKEQGYKGKQITQGLKFDVVKVGPNICVKSIEPLPELVEFAPKKPVSAKPPMKRPDGVTVNHDPENLISIAYVRGTPVEGGTKYNTDGWYKGGRLTSKRPKQNNDCTVRAFACAFDLDYDYVYDMFAAAGRKCSNGFHLGPWMERNAVDGYILDRRIAKISFPAERGVPRMNLETFVKRFDLGTYIVRVAKHVACIRDGVILDWMTVGGHGYKCVYLAYKITKI